jgi:hypothetical protein
MRGQNLSCVKMNSSDEETFGEPLLMVQTEPPATEDSKGGNIPPESSANKHLENDSSAECPYDGADADVVAPPPSALTAPKSVMSGEFLKQSE